MTLLQTTVQAGIFLPEATIQSEIFAVLATFVALNTIMYAALATAKILPKIYLSDWFRRNNERAETRSIYPDPEISYVARHVADKAANPAADRAADDAPAAAAEEEAATATSSSGTRHRAPRHLAA